ncbi:MAG: GDP-mannose 4,6-dehydratase [Candidatus Nitrosotenuis sp.]
MKPTTLFNKKRILIIGGTGFIGSHLAHRLIRDDAGVFIISKDDRLPILIEDIKDRVKIYFTDITDLQSLIRIFKEVKPCIIYHLSAMIDARNSPNLIRPLINVNMLGTLNALMACIEIGDIERFIYISTSDVYGFNNSDFSEDSELEPISLYGFSKACAELSCKTFSKLYNMPIVIIRPFVVYGGGQSPNMFIPQLILSAIKGEEFLMTGGEQTRDFLYVDDFVEACIKVLLSDKVIGKTINIASGKDIPLKEVAEKVVSAFGDSIRIKVGALPYRENERWRVKADINKAKDLLGWEPKIDLNEGIKRTVEWYLNHKEWFV